MTMKRSREEEEEEGREVETLAMANCVVLLDRINQTATSTTTSSLDRVFKCKTCGRKFRSFQALGGHRASHKWPKSISSSPSSSIKIKAKLHECSICGLEFEMGQALGGHMRRHRADMINKKHNTRVVPVPAQVLKRSDDDESANVWLDLNLTPYENDLKLGYQIMAPLFTHCF